MPRSLARFFCLTQPLLDIGADQVIPLPNVTGKILQKVITYCQYHLEHPTPVSEEKKDEKRTDDISPWDLEFCKVDQATLFELILAANYLDIRPLLDLTCKTVANMIKGMCLRYVARVARSTNPLPQARPPRRSARRSTSRTTSLPRRRSRSARRTSGARSVKCEKRLSLRRRRHTMYRTPWRRRWRI